MVIDSSGKVGIGMNAPNNALDVNGNIGISSTTLPMGLVTELNTSSNPVLNLSVNSYLPNVNAASIGGIFRIDSRSTGTTPLFQWIRKPQDVLNPMPNDILMTLTDLGRLGVGVANPTRGAIEIGWAGELQTASNYGFLGNSGAGTNPGSQLALYSLYASGTIGASFYHAFSDARIKRIIQRSNSQADLNTLLAIQITDYQHIDTIQKGNQVHKKVIAQQVAEVFPQAVKKDTKEVIPDIYQRTEYRDGWIQLTTNLEVGDRVKLITTHSKDIHEVTAVKVDRFQVTNLDVEEGVTVFVYGREVDDFHTVDYEAIAMLNVSATQAQQERIEALEAENRVLKAQNARQKASNEAIESRLSQIEALLEAKAEATVQH
ncbi:MAG: tail fiber domain-containing protein [Bacteroidota bacterium]